MADPIVEAGNFKYDTEGMQIVFAANGAVDGPATITSDPAHDDGLGLDGAGLRLVISADGNTVKVFADKDIVNGSITANQPADDTSTPDMIEAISRTVTFNFSHSKATSMAANVTHIPREEPATP